MLLPRNVKDVLLKTKAIENLMYRYGSLLKSYMSPQSFKDRQTPKENAQETSNAEDDLLR